MSDLEHDLKVSLDEAIVQVRRAVENASGDRVSLALWDLTAVLGALADREELLRLMEPALALIWAVRPSNWDDDDDPAQLAAWTAVQRALAA